ncbi:CRISPR-associated protein Cas4 [Desulfurobacterium sp.]|uniref:CRISPR-associated protein Cas4 n=1 Tax=Desulfurobacterium sp. TaxID=2004706 RepID=UPI00262047CF|nr:CRISPR-associated protein Cas4 [Desulfurobacterium sp.]
MLSKTAFFTGTKVAYFVICHTKLWLFSHFLTRENESELVALGSLLQETSFKSMNKDIIVDQRIGIDFIKKGNKLILHEIKKSDKLEKAHLYQLLYYIYYLKKLKGLESEGRITYPLKRKVVKVQLTEENEKEIERILKEIRKIISLPNPPKPEYKRYCRRCSYFEFCFG